MRCCRFGSAFTVTYQIIRIVDREGCCNFSITFWNCYRLSGFVITSEARDLFSSTRNGAWLWQHLSHLIREQIPRAKRRS
jgi:hypothetical protein